MSKFLNFEYRNPIRRTSAVLSVITILLALFGCDGSGDANKADKAAPKPSVVVAAVNSKAVSDFSEFVGQTKAFQKVELQARVKGLLAKRLFDEGSSVKKGQLLLEIDPAEFVAARDAALAQKERVDATLLEAERNFSRYEVLVQRQASSEAKLDEARAKRDQAKADLSAAKADLVRAELNLGYTKIDSEIKGTIGASSIDPGNIIGPESGVLATVITLDPIYVTFPVSENMYINYRKSQKEGKAGTFTPKIRMANGDVYEHPGKMDFVNNEVDPTTGTITVRVTFSNPDELLLPGFFVNVFLVSDNPENQLIVQQSAVQQNQTGPFVLVVNKDNKIEARPIETGQRVGTDVVVTEGLTKGERIVIEGLQKVRPGVEVDPVQQTASAKVEDK